MRERDQLEVVATQWTLFHRDVAIEPLEDNQGLIAFSLAEPTVLHPPTLPQRPLAKFDPLCLE